MKWIILIILGIMTLLGTMVCGVYLIEIADYKIRYVDCYDKMNNVIHGVQCEERYNTVFNDQLFEAGLFMFIFIGIILILKGVIAFREFYQKV